jgi:hypothetical protein
MRRPRFAHVVEVAMRGDDQADVGLFRAIAAEPLVLTLTLTNA